MDANVIVRCVVCGKQFFVSEAQARIMQSIGAVTCSATCAVKWVSAD